MPNSQTSQIPPQERPRTAQRDIKIREHYATGRYSYNKLARIFNLSPQRIAQIIKGDNS